MLAEELGRIVAPTPFSSTVYLAAEALLLAGSEAQKRRWLPRIAAGEAIGCLALAEGPQAPTPESLTTRARTAACSTATKAPVADGDVADFAIVAARDGRAVSLFLVDLARRGREAARRSTTVDPTRSHASITFATRRPSRSARPAPAGRSLERVLDRAAVLVAFEQVGGAQAALNMAREYALGRFAFGRPIASFQAIKHKLADMYVAIKLARSNATTARGRCRPTPPSCRWPPPPPA